jgi:DNA-binding MarR family transcriptional regulator
LKKWGDGVIDKLAAAAGLPGAELSALSVVVFAGPILLGDLAAAEQVRPPSMTRTVRALECGG